jgi:hypothetical protein
MGGPDSTEASENSRAEVRVSGGKERALRGPSEWQNLNGREEERASEMVCWFRA